MTTIQNFSDILLKVVSYADDQKDVVKNMLINEFLGGSIDFQKFVETVEAYSKGQVEKNDDMQYLADYAAYVKGVELTEDSLGQLKEALKQAIAPFKIEKIEGDTVLEAMGNNIIMSEVINKVEADPSFKNGAIKEVRIVGRSIIHVDIDLNQAQWHGKNFVVWTDELNVVKVNCVWNFSGFNEESTFSENAGMDDQGNGKDGADGKPGESGGNVAVKAETVRRGIHLKIISNGGQGGEGQDGGNGLNGVNGRNVTNSDLDEIPDSADTSYETGEENYKTAERVITEKSSGSPFIKKYDGGRWGNSYIKAKFANGFEVTYINFQLVKCLTLIRGSEGTYGGKGGKHGLGGEGGSPGQIDLDVPRDSRIQTENFKGNAGREGDGGYFGRNGIKGADRARLKWVKENELLKILAGIFTAGIHTLVNHVRSDITGDIIPVNYGEGGNQYLELFNTSYDNTESVWCLHTNTHVKIDNAGNKPNDAVKVYQQNSTKQIRERQKHALAIPQRALDLTKMQERYKSTFARAQFDVSGIKKRLKVKVQEETKIKQQVDQEIKFTQTIASDIKKPSSRKPRVLETDNTDNVGVNKTYKVNDFSAVINAKYNAFEKIGNETFQLPIVDLNEVKNAPDKMQQFMRLKRDIDDTAPNEILLELNKDILDRDKFVKELDPPPFSDKNQCNSVIKEFIVGRCSLDVQQLTHGYLTKFENFSKHQLNQRLAIVDKHDGNDQTMDGNLMVNDLNEINKVKFQDWNIIRKNKTIMDKLYTHFKECERDCPTFLELVASAKSINIRVYEKDEVNDKFILKNSYNSRSNTVIYLIKSDDEQFMELELNENLYKFQLHQEYTEKRYRKIINDIEALRSSASIESYVNEKKYEKELNIDTCPFETSLMYNFVSSGNISYIVKLFVESPVTKEAKSLTEKLDTLVQLGAASTVHYIADRLRNSQNPNVTIRDVTLVINTALQLVDQKQQFATIDWILATRKPKEWIVYVTLLRLENYFQEKLENKFSSWENYLKKITNENIIILFCLKLAVTDRAALDMKKVDIILYLLSVSEPDIISVSNLKLQEWTFVLKEFYWKFKLKEAIKWDKDDQYTQKAVHLLLTVENKHQFNTTKALIDAFSKGDVSVEEDKQTFIEILQKFADEAWNITNDVLLSVQASSKVSEWKNLIEKLMPDADHIRTADELMQIIKDQLNLESASMSSLLQSAQKRIFDQMSDIRKLMEDTKTFGQTISKWTVADLKNNFNKHRTIEKRLAMIDHGVYLWSKEREGGKGWHLRDTQKLSALTAVKNPKILLQIATGEGKSLIVAAVAIMRVLDGQQVDVITTSPVLAERDVEELKSLYDMFNITVSHNTADASSERQTAYLSNVVYGALSNFQRDYLLDQFYNKGIRGNRQFASVIVDEVDSMLLDKGNSTLYLSHEIPELDKLESIYLHIWTRVILAKTMDKGKNLLWDTKNIANEIKKSIYGLIDEADVRQLKRSIDDAIIVKVLEILRKENITDENDFLVNDKTFDKNDLSTKLKKHSELEELIDPLLVLIQQRIDREKLVSPKYLKSFILENLNRWIDNAKLALYLRDRDDYIVDKDHHNEESKDTVVTILDKDTGTDQVNSQWDSGLHQFLQLKHGCRLTPQSLKAVFISNVSYFKKYSNLNGLSGTLGSEVERQHLVEAHAVDFLTVPTFKQKQFSEDLPIVESTTRGWSMSIFSECMRKVNTGRSVLIVCETVEAVEQLYKLFVQKLGKIDNVKKYTRDYEKLDVIHNDKKLTPGHILIATNLAGRGTDLKLDKNVTKAGGLHVIVTYLTANDRVEHQAMGRAARKGDPGSGQLIVLSDDFLESNVSSYRMFKLKSQRRIKEAEHVSTVRKHYEDQIKYEEECFLRFNRAWEKNRKRLSEMVNGDETNNAARLIAAVVDQNRKVPSKVQELLERGILDKWAFWLDSNMGHDRKIEKDAIYSKMDAFINSITNFGVEQDDWVKWVDPLAQSVSIGKIFAKEGATADKAIHIFDQVILNEPDFCEGALYYKALAFFQKNQKETVFETLTRARQMFERRKENSEGAKALIANVKQRTANVDSQSMAFEDQQDRVTKIQDTFIKSIDDIIGHYADEKLLEATDASNFEIKFAMENLRKKREFIGNSVLSPILLDSSFKRYCEGKGVNFEILKKFTLDNRSKVNDIPAFIQALKTSKLNMPNREDFWDILEKAQILNDAKVFYHIYMSEIELVDPAFKDKLMKEKQRAKPLEQYLYLYPEFVDASSKYLTFRESVFKRLVPEKTLTYLKRHNCFSINKCAKVDMEKLAQYNFEHFSSIKLTDLVTSSLNEKIATEIVQALVELKVLVKHTEDAYKPTEKYFTFDFEMPDIKIPSLYMDMIQQKLENSFAYASAAHQLLKTKAYDKSTRLKLNARAHETLVSEMISHGIISNSKLSINGDVKQISEKLRNIFKGEIYVSNLEELPSANRNVTKIIEELKNTSFISPNSSDTYAVKKAITDSDKFRFETKTVKLLLNTIHKLNTGSYISELSNVLHEKAGTYNVITEDFELVTKPLSEFTELETKEEEQQFSINGQNEILIGQKKKKESTSFWAILTIIIVAIVAIVVGAVLAYFGLAPLATILISTGIQLLVIGLQLLMTEVEASNVRGLKNNSIAAKAIRFITEILKSIRKYLFWEEKHEADVTDEDQKFKKIISTDVQKLNLAKRTTQYETIINQQLNGLTEKVMGIMKNEITEAINRSNIRDDVRRLYETFSSKLVMKEINKIDDFVLSLERFKRKMEPSMNTFKAEIIGNIDKITQKLGVDSIKSLATFRKALKGSIEEGIKLFEGNRSTVFETLEKSVLNIYKEGLERAQKTLTTEDQSKSVLPVTKRTKMVESKYQGISESLVKSSKSLLSDINNDIQAEVKQVVLYKVNSLVNKQIRSISGSSDTLIDMNEQHLLEKEDLTEIKLSLIENEYHTILATLKPLVQKIDDKKVCGQIKPEHFEQMKQTLVTKHAKSQYETLIQRHHDIFEPNVEIFANQDYNYRLITDAISQSIKSTDSKIFKAVKNEIDSLIYALVENDKSSYYVVIRKLYEIYQHNQVSNCFNDLYKLCVLSTIESNNEKWININAYLDVPSTLSEIGLINLKHGIVIAATHNIKQPFIWESFKVLDEPVNVTVVKAKKKIDDVSPPSVKLQLLKHVDLEADDDDLPQEIKLYLNGITIENVDSTEISLILADKQVILEEGTQVTLDAIKIINKFKNYLTELQDIAFYLECNRDKFEELVKEKRKSQRTETSLEQPGDVSDGESDENSDKTQTPEEEEFD